MTADLRKRLPRFFIAGFLATLVHVITYTAQVELLRIDPVVAVVPAFAIATIASYSVNHAWTFEARGNHGVFLPRFICVALIGLVLNLLITTLLVDLVGLAYGWGLATCVTVLPFVTFFMNRWWTFSRVHSH